MKIRNLLAVAAVAAVLLAGASITGAVACDKAEKASDSKVVAANADAKAADAKEGCAGKGCCKKKATEIAKAKTEKTPAKAEAVAVAGASK